MTAFGFSLKTNQYKVIRFFLQEVVYIDHNTQMGSYREEAEAKIYTIGGEGLWRNMGKVPYHLTNHSFNSFVMELFIGLISTMIVPASLLFRFGTEEFRSGNEESWSKEFVIGNVVSNKKGGFDYYEPIMIPKTGEILMLYNKDGLVLYDPKLGGFKKLSIYWIKSEFYGAAHNPSLVSLCDVAEGEYFSLIRCQRTKG
ncbi:hypothetical protein ACSBR2_011970 [Camellia fascicularis]